MSNSFPKRDAKPAKTTLKTPTTDTTNTPKPQVTFNPQHISPDNVLYLQRTIGNKAVSDLLRAQSKTSEPTIQRQLMSYDEFLQKTGQTQNRERFSDTQNRNANLLNQARMRMNPDARALDPREFETIGEKRRIIDINAAYAEVGKSETIENLAKLYDSITYWQSMYGQMQETRQYAPVLNNVLTGIKERVNELSQSENKMLKPDGGMPAKPKSRGMMEKLKDKVIPGRAADTELQKIFTAQMPAFMKQLEIPYEWFTANCLDDYGEPDDKKMEALGRIFNALQRQQGQPTQENIAAINFNIKRLDALIGETPMYMIKQNLFSRYKQVLGENFDRTQQGIGAAAPAGNQLTAAEINAIVRYSVQDFEAINKAARSAKVELDASDESKESKRLGRPPTRDEIKAAFEKEDMNNLIRLVVSGLNKLPPFVGTTYRGLKNAPEGFEKSVTKGSAIADLGFSSSSPSMAVVYEFLYSAIGKNTRNVFYILHSKTGVNIVELSLNAREGEVLFKPGTRFKVDNIWTHDEKGQVPAAAPPEAKMILHRKSAYVNDEGKSLAEFQQLKDGAIRKGIKGAEDRTWTSRAQTKVVEATEI